MSAKRLQIFAIFSLLATPALAEPPPYHEVIYDYGAQYLTSEVAQQLSEEIGVKPVRTRQWDCAYSNCRRYTYYWRVGNSEYRLEGGAAARWLSVGTVDQGARHGKTIPKVLTKMSEQ